MVILELSSLKPSSELYDFASGKLKIRDLEERINSIQPNYSKNFIRILNLMLIIEPEKRLTSSKMYKRYLILLFSFSF